MFGQRAIDDYFRGQNSEGWAETRMQLYSGLRPPERVRFERQFPAQESGEVGQRSTSFQLGADQGIGPEHKFSSDQIYLLL